MNKNNIAKSILATLIVIGILLITGLYYWLIFSHSKDFTFIIIIFMTAIISNALVLFVYNLMLKMKPKDKNVEVKGSKTKTPEMTYKHESSEIKESESQKDENGCVDLYSCSNTGSPQVANAKNKKTNNYIDEKTV